MKKLFFLLIIFVFLLSCRKIPFISPNTREFIAYKKIGDKDVLVRFNANKIASTLVADAYLEDGQHIEQNKIDEIMENFTEIRRESIEMYGATTDVDKNKKILLVFFDINGGKVPAGSSYIGGYFYSGDLIEGAGNNGEILYIDCINGPDDVDSLCGTISHEFQHLINYYMNDISIKRACDLWLNEALSESSEILYRKAMPGHRLNYYNNDPDSLIANGEYFYIWHGLVENYATASLFMYWLKTQANNGYNIYREIAQAGYLYRGSYLAVSNAANNHINGLNNANWNKILLEWYIANYKNGSGLSGYNGTIILNSPSMARSSNGELALYPGSAVYIEDYMKETQGITYFKLDVITKIALNPDFNFNSSGIAINVSKSPIIRSRKAANHNTETYFIDFHPKIRRLTPYTNN